MKPTFRNLKDQAASALNEISINHTRGLLVDEEFLIRNVLLASLTQLDLNISDECIEYWSPKVAEARGRLSFETVMAPFRKSITEKIAIVLGSLKTVEWNKEQKETFVKSIKNELKKSITELMNSKKKRLEEREKAKAITQSSMDITIFNEEKMVTEPEDARKSEINPKPPFKRVSGSGKYGRR